MCLRNLSFQPIFLETLNLFFEMSVIIIIMTICSGLTFLGCGVEGAGLVITFPYLGTVEL